jgi:predicted dehydrogenase
VTKLKYGILGVGQRGTALARAALLIDEVEAQAVAFADPHGPSRAAFSELVANARPYERAQTLAAEAAINAVLTAAPDAQQVDQALAAIRRRAWITWFRWRWNCA